MKVEWVPIGDVARLLRFPLEIDPVTTYQQIGVRGFGRGIFSYDPVLGDQLGRMRYFTLEPKRLVVSNIKGWEGAVAITHDNESGRIVSNRFLTYESDEMNLSYLRHWLLSEPGLRLLGQASPGSADRNRTLSIGKFERIPVPAVSRKRQDQIAGHLASLTKRIHLAATPDVSFASRIPCLLRGVISQATDFTVSLGELATNQQTVIHPGDDLRGASEFVGLEHIESHTGRRIGGRPIGNETGRKLLFTPGQVTYGYLRPYLNKAWVADRTGLCSVEQFTLTSNPGVDPRVLSVVLRSDSVWLAAQSATNSLQLPRLSLGALMSFEVPDVRGLAWESIAPEVERITSLIVREAKLRSQRQHLHDSILPAARNEIFESMR